MLKKKLFVFGLTLVLAFSSLSTKAFANEQTVDSGTELEENGEIEEKSLIPEDQEPAESEEILEDNEADPADSANESTTTNEEIQSVDDSLEIIEQDLTGEIDSGDDLDLEEEATVEEKSEELNELDSNNEQNQNSGQSAPVLSYEESEEIMNRIQNLAATAEQFDYTKPADFLFVIDSTGSMDSYIQSVRSNLTSFVNYLNEKNVNIRMAVIDFKDITSDGNDSTIIHRIDGQPWSDNSKKIIEQFNSIQTDGGGDDPETPTDAFSKIIAGDINWRNDAQKFVFLLTDADYKDSSDDSNIKSMDECVRDFRENGVHATIVGKLAYETHYEALFRLTGGKYIDIDSSDYYKLMIEIADWVYEALSDMDGDGIPDDWETNGVDTDNDGKIDLDLKKMGADPKVRDIFVEVDWMYQPYIPGYFLWIEYTKQEEKNLCPSNSAMRIVYNQFKAHGINLHIDAGPDSIDYVTGKRWGSLSGANSIPYEKLFDIGTNYEKWNNTALAHFARNRWSVFRYCLFINKFDEAGHSGLAENIPGQFFLVAVVNGGVSSNDRKLAGTFMHELGHTLGLGHGGDDHVNNKPNYLSIMNYLFQFSGLTGTNEVNYSEYVLPELDESALDERRGVDPNRVTRGTGLGTKWYYEKENRFLWFKTGNTIEEGMSGGVSGSSIDFNYNGSIENNVSVNLNQYSDVNLPQSTNDWNRLILKGGLIGGLGSTDESEETVLIKKNPDLDEALNELTYDDALELGLLGNPGDCEIESINPKRIYNNIEGQQLNISIANLSSEDTSVGITVTSDLLDNNYNDVLTVSGSKGEIKNSILEIPVADNIEEGVYSVSCELTLENGTTETWVEEVQVLPALVLELKVGESKEILPDKNVNESFTWEGSNSYITVTEDGKATANKEGSAIVTGTTEEHDQLVCIIKAINSQGTDSFEQKDQTGSGSNIQKENTNEKPVEQEIIKISQSKDEGNVAGTNKEKSQQRINESNSKKNNTATEKDKEVISRTETRGADTGDESHAGAYGITFVVSAVIVILLLSRKKHSV